MAKCFHLTVTLPDEKPETFTLGASQILLGRGGESRIPMEVPSVSTRHCLLERTPDGYQVRDLGSRNGTLLNGQMISADPVPLSHGDRLVLGEVVKLRFTESKEIGDEMAGPRIRVENGGEGRPRKPDPAMMVNPVAAAVAAATQKLKR